MTFYNRISTNVISHYFKGFWENTQNHRATLQALMKRGHVETGVSGSNLVWNVRGGRYSMNAYDELASIDITRQNQYFQCNLPWAFLEVHDGISRDEIAMASGDAALVKHEKEMLKNLTSDFQTRLNASFLTTNGATATGNVLYGFPTMFQDSGSYTAGNKTAVAQGTYAGQSIKLSDLTVDGAESNAWSPTLVNYTSTAFNSGSAATWAGQCLKVITYAKDQITFGNSEEDMPDLLIVDRGMFSDLKYAITSQQRMIVSSGAPDGAGLGIKGAIEHDGIEVVFDNDQTANTGFLLNFHQLYLECLPKPATSNPGPDITGKSSTKDYFEVLTEDDIRSNGILARVNFRAQLRGSVKHQAKLFNYA